MKNVGIDFGIVKRRLKDFVFSSPKAIEFSGFLSAVAREKAMAGQAGKPEI